MARKQKNSKILRRWYLIGRKKSCDIKEPSKFTVAEVATIAIVTSFISLLMGLMISNSNSSVKYKALSKNVQQFLNDYSTITENYYGEFDEKDVLDKALQTIIDELGDPYTGVVDDSLSNNLNTKMEGSYDGLGVQVSMTTSNEIIIVDIFEDTPAERAGLQIYDIITSLNGQSIEGITTTEFANLVKQCNDETIVLGISRNKESLEISLKREKVILKSIYSKVMEKNDKRIGYICISVFAANTDVQFIEALKDLEEQGIDSLLIDLRDNTGGHLSSVKNIMSYMVSSKKIIYQMENKNGVDKVYSSGNKDYDKEIVILTNQNSASASEMLTACLKENLNAKSVGMTTYGKGTAQEVQTTSSGVSYKLTVSKWLTPNGNWINEKGINPDYEIELQDECFTNPSDENDNQLQKALEIISK